MKEWFQEISELTVLEILIIGFALLLVLRILEKGISVYVDRRQGSPVIKRFFPLVEFGVWVVFLMWGAKQIFQTGIAGSIVLMALVVGILTWAGSFVVRDWIAGIVFKAEDRYRVDDLVSFQTTRGRLRHLGYRAITLETADGRTVEIPYSALVKESTLEKVSRTAACATFALAVPASEPFPLVVQRIQAAALCAPWSAITRIPQIRLLDRQENHYTVEVAACMVDQCYAADVEAYVKRHVTF